MGHGYSGGTDSGGVSARLAAGGSGTRAHRGKRTVALSLCISSRLRLWRYVLGRRRSARPRNRPADLYLRSQLLRCNYAGPVGFIDPVGRSVAGDRTIVDRSTGHQFGCLCGKPVFGFDSADREHAYYRRWCSDGQFLIDSGNWELAVPARILDRNSDDGQKRSPASRQRAGSTEFLALQSGLSIRRERVGETGDPVFYISG